MDMDGETIKKKKLPRVWLMLGYTTYILLYF